MAGGCGIAGEGTLARWRRAAAKRIGFSCASFFSSHAASPSPPPPKTVIISSLSLPLSTFHQR
jgi:hypothetical protein